MGNGLIEGIKPILVVKVGYGSTRGKTEEEVDSILNSKTRIAHEKTCNQYHVLTVVDYSFESGLRFKVL